MANKWWFWVLVIGGLFVLYIIFLPSTYEPETNNSQTIETINSLIAQVLTIHHPQHFMVILAPKIVLAMKQVIIGLKSMA